MNRLIAACACLVVPFVAASSLSLGAPTSTRAASERSVLAQGNAQQLYNSGVTRAERGDYQGAIQDFTQAIGVNPNFADAYVSRGEARVALEDYQAAVADFDLALRLEPNNADAFEGRAEARAGLGDNREPPMTSSRLSV